MNIHSLVIQHAASPSNPPKGYGSIDAGIRVMMYRGVRVQHYSSLGHAYDVAASLAQADVIAMYGEPWVSVDEDGIPI